MINILNEDIFTSPLLAKPKQVRKTRVDKDAVIEAQAAKIAELTESLAVEKSYRLMIDLYVESLEAKARELRDEIDNINDRAFDAMIENSLHD